MTSFKVTAYATVQAHKTVIVEAADHGLAMRAARDQLSDDSVVSDGWTVMDELSGVGDMSAYDVELAHPDFAPVAMDGLWPLVDSDDPAEATIYGYVDSEAAALALCATWADKVVKVDFVVIDGHDCWLGRTVESLSVEEVFDLIRAKKIQVFSSMGAYYYAAPGVGTDHRVNPACTGWKGSYASSEEAARAALAA